MLPPQNNGELPLLQYPGHRPLHPGNHPRRTAQDGLKLHEGVNAHPESLPVQFLVIELQVLGGVYDGPGALPLAAMPADGGVIGNGEDHNPRLLQEAMRLSDTGEVAREKRARLHPRGTARPFRGRIVWHLSASALTMRGKAMVASA